MLEQLAEVRRAGSRRQQLGAGRGTSSTASGPWSVLPQGGGDREVEEVGDQLGDRVRRSAANRPLRSSASVRGRQTPRRLRRRSRGSDLLVRPGPRVRAAAPAAGGQPAPPHPSSARMAGPASGSERMRIIRFRKRADLACDARRRSPGRRVRASREVPGGGGGGGGDRSATRSGLLDLPERAVSHLVRSGER